VPVDGVITALKQRGEELTVADIVELNRSFDKVRWEFGSNESKIRATHGHSIAVILDEKALTPPSVLYHGTSLNNLDIIKETGLLAMQRQFVHLSSDSEIALSVGKRHGKPVLIKIDAAALANDGWVFYKTNDNVWLTASIPVKYLNFNA